MTWTAYYAPKDESFAKSGFVSREAAQLYAKKQKHLDAHAWFF